MTVWLVAALALLVGLIPCALLVLRRNPADGLVGLVAAGVVVTLILVAMSVGLQRSIYGDVAVVVAVLSFAGGLVFVQYLERWG